MIPGWIAAPGVVLALIVALFGVRTLDRYFGLPAEVRRKSLHIGMGLVCMSFPWLFDDIRWVAAASTGALAVMFMLRRAGHEAGSLGSTLFGVARRSFGEIYFAVAVLALFWLSAGDPVLYATAILVLTIGDAAAALIGVTYGRTKYQTREGAKSWEGSIALAFVTFLAVHVPLLLFTDIGRAEALLIALIVALLVIMLEGMAWHGLDNLMIPLGVWFVLKGLRWETAVVLTSVLTIILAASVIALLFGRRAQLKTDGVLAAVVAGAVYWAAAGIYWFLPAAIVFVAHPFLARLNGQPADHDDPADVGAVMGIVLSTSPWLFLYFAGLGERALYPFAVGFGAHLAIILVWQQIAGSENKVIPLQRLLLIGLQSWAVMAIPCLLAYGVSNMTLQLGLAALPFPYLAGLAYGRFAPIGRNPDRLISHGVISVMTAGLSLVPLVLIVP